jgi:hypothetical protein
MEINNKYRAAATLLSRRRDCIPLGWNLGGPKSKSLVEAVEKKMISLPAGN